jgi:hypothetical protein
MSRIPLRRKVLYSLASLLLLLACAETILRLHDFSFYYNFSADLLGMPLLDLHSLRRVQNRTVDYDPYLFWKFKPNQDLVGHGIYLKPVHINAHGFRGHDFNAHKSEGTYRIACLGDSTTFGWSVGEGEPFPDQLETILRQRCPGRPVEVLNLGVTGYSSFQGRQLMTRYVSAWKPDLVIFAFGPNDRLPALKSDAQHQRDRTWDLGPAALFLNRFQVYKLLRAGVVYLHHRRQGLSLDPKTYIPRLRRKVSPREFTDNVLQVKAVADHLQADLLLVHVDFPSLPPDHVDRELRKTAAKCGAEMPADWEPWEGARLHAELAHRLSLPWLDLRTLFVETLDRIQAGDLDPERAAPLHSRRRKQLRLPPTRQ